MQALNVQSNSLIFICAYIVALIAVVQISYGRSMESTNRNRHNHILTTDQPGRILAVFVLAPILFFKSVEHNDAFIHSFAVLLFTWDLYWLIRLPPRS